VDRSYREEQPDETEKYLQADLDYVVGIGHVCGLEVGVVWLE
jgi:hypothetical protein